MRNSVITSLLTLTTLGLAAQVATAMTVTPVVLDLKASGRGMNQVVSVENTAAAAIPVELTAQDLIINASGAHPTQQDSGDLVIFPQQALIQPGQTQIFRVQYVGDPAIAKARHYYITVAQLPVKMPGGQSGVQIVYNFEVLTSVGPANTRAALRVVGAGIGKDDTGKPVAVAMMANDSATYGYLSHGTLRVVESDQSGREIFSKTLSGAEIGQTLGIGLVDAGEQRRFVLPGVLPSAAGAISVTFKASKN